MPRQLVLDGEVRNFPQAPFSVAWLGSTFYSSRFAGAWKFNPSTMPKTPRPLQFAV
jgi:hypothetical protein